MSQDSEERSEKATPKRMKEVRAQGPAHPLAGPHRLARHRRRRRSCCPRRSPRGSEAGARPAVGGAQHHRRNPTRSSPSQALGDGLRLAARHAGAAVRGRAWWSCWPAPALQGGIHFKKFKRQVRAVQPGHRRQAGLRHAGALAGRQGAAEDRGRRPRALRRRPGPDARADGVPAALPRHRAADAASRRRRLAASSAPSSPGSVLAAADVFVVMRRNRKKTRMTQARRSRTRTSAPTATR